MQGDRAGFWTRAAVAAGVFVLTLCTAAPSARADVVLLKDGKQYVGVVVEETADAVKFRTKLHNIETTITIKKKDIDKLEKGELQPGFLESKKPEAPASRPAIGGGGNAPTSPPAPDSGPTDPKGGTQYLVVPIKGTIGEDAGPDGVKEALSAALNRRITHIVFDIDTGGGLLDAARGMQDAIKAHRELAKKRGVETRLHAYIRRCISAGIWIAFCCDDIWFDNGSNIGGAVVYHKSQTTGAAEVDAKMNSIIASDLGTFAESLGHNSAVVKAMIVVPSTLFAWEDAEGETAVGESRPTDRGAKNVRSLDNESTILTLTGDQAVELGVGKKAAGGPEGIGRFLDIDDWKSAGNAGAGAMKKDADRTKRAIAEQQGAQKEIEEIRKDVEAIDSVMPGLLKRAQAADPGNFKYTVFQDTGFFTAESRAQWVSRTDEAVKLWNQVLEGLKRYDKLDKRFKELTGESFVKKTEGRMAVDAVVSVIDRLKRERNKSGL